MNASAARQQLERVGQANEKNDSETTEGDEKRSSWIPATTSVKAQVDK